MDQSIYEGGEGVEYDPNRSSRIALLHYVDGAKAYIIAPEGLHVGDKVISGTKDVDIIMV